MITHEFHTSNAFADKHAFYAKKVYQDVFQTSEVRLVTDRDGQRSGVDVLVGAGIRPIRIEEKIRRKQYKDIFLEIWSSEEQKILGWADKPLICDYLSYIVLETGTVRLYSYPLFRHAWQRNKEKWKQTYEIRRIPNRGRYSDYTTVGVCVPINVLNKQIVMPWEKAEK